MGWMTGRQAAKVLDERNTWHRPTWPNVCARRVAFDLGDRKREIVYEIEGEYRRPAGDM